MCYRIFPRVDCVLYLYDNNFCEIHNTYCVGEKIYERVLSGGLVAVLLVWNGVDEFFLLLLLGGERFAFFVSR